MTATLKGSDVVRSTSPNSPLKPMDHSNNNPNQPPPYYYPENIIYTQDVYLPDASTSTSQGFSQNIYQQQQQQQQQQYAYERYHRQQQLQMQMHQHPHPQQPRSHSHLQTAPPPPPPPSQQQAYHQQPLLQHQHDQLRHAHAMPAASPPLRHSVSADRITSPPRPSRSPVSEASYHSDPLTSLRSDLQVHAAATALTQAGDHYSSSGVPRLPPILQVEKQQVTTTATQAASASRRRNEATFRCPVPGCGSTFTRRFNLKGHLRSHTSEKPYVCEWPGCGKGFARQHDCKRHYQLHSAKAGTHMCLGCGKSFSRTDALNRHLRSEGGAECRLQHQAATAGGSSSGATRSSRGDDSESPYDDSTTDGTPNSRPPSV